MEYLNKNKTIVVRSSPDNSHYKQLKDKLNNDQSIMNGLNDRNVQLVEDTNARNNGFNFYLYGQDGSLFLSDNSFGDNTFQNVFNVVDGMTPKPHQSGGSKEVNYREKYMKYKHKYDELRTVITSFASHVPQQ